LPLSDRDRVRLAVGDTDATDPILTDDEVDDFLAQRYVVDTTGGTTYNVVAAAADCAGAIAAKYARDFSFAEDGQRFDRAQRVGHYQALERQLRARQGGASVQVTLGGTASSS